MKIKARFLMLFIILTQSSFCQIEPLKPSELQSAISFQKLKDTSFYGSKFSNFSFKSEAGKEYSNTSLLGKLHVIHFWFAACIPCLTEMPDVNKLYLRFKDNPNFEFVSLTFDDSLTVRNSIARYDIKFPTISATELELRDILKIYGKGYPSTFLIGRDGRIMFMSNSLTTDPKFAIRLIPTIDSILAKE
jgi:peroxiredoxin